MSLLPTGAYAALAIAAIAVAVVSAVAQLGPLRPARGAVIALPFMFVALPLVFTRGGELLATVPLGPLQLNISADGVRQFTTIALKSWVSVQVALLLAYTTPFHRLVDALRALRLPRLLVSTIGFMYRYLGVLLDEAARMSRARAARSAVAGSGGTRGGGSLRWRASVTGGMVGSLFLRSYERSERVYAAMQARGFQGELRQLESPRIGAGQGAAAVAVAIVLVLFAVAGQLWLPRL